MTSQLLQIDYFETFIRLKQFSYIILNYQIYLDCICDIQKI
jgi:hypothetical protein